MWSAQLVCVLSVSKGCVRESSLASVVAILQEIRDRVHVATSLGRIRAAIVGSRPYTVVSSKGVRTELPITVRIMNAFFYCQTCANFFVNGIQESATQPLHNSVLYVNERSIFRVPQFQISGKQAVLIVSRCERFAILRVGDIRRFLDGARDNVSASAFQRVVDLPMIRIRVFKTSRGGLLITF